MTERTAKKLLPIFQELQRRAVQFRTNKADDGCSDYERIDLDDDDLKVESAKDKGGMKQSKSKGKLVGMHKFLDMRHILGFLNQSEWVNSLNIGNIMQITPIQRDDLTMHRRNEQEVSRDSFLETVTFKYHNLFIGKLLHRVLLLHLNRNPLHHPAERRN